MFDIGAFDIVAEVAKMIDQSKNIVTDGIQFINNLLQQSSSRQIEIVKREYRQRLLLAKEYMDTQVSAYKYRISEINAEIKALDRKEKDDDYKDKINRLNEQYEYENDDFNKYEIQKEIQRLQDEYSKRKNRERLQDEKDSLQLLIEWTKDVYNQQKILYERALNQELNMLQAQLDQKKLMLEQFGDSHTLSAILNSGNYDQLINSMSSIISYGGNSQSVNVYQTIQSTVSSPAQLAREMSLALENALRYGF